MCNSQLMQILDSLHSSRQTLGSTMTFKRKKVETYFNDLIVYVQVEASRYILVVHPAKISYKGHDKELWLRGDDFGGQSMVRRRQVSLQALVYRTFLGGGIENFDDILRIGAAMLMY